VTTALCLSMVQHVDARKKGDSKVVKQLRADISYLASDDLEGRRTGTEGEKKAADYIEKRYAGLKIAPYKGAYKHQFKFTYGKEPAKNSAIKLFNTPLSIPTDAYPVPFSAAKSVFGDVLPDVTERGSIWLQPLYTDSLQANDPHFDADKQMYEAAKEAMKAGATGIVFYGNFGGRYEPTFNAHSDLEVLDVPVCYITNKTWIRFNQKAENNSQKSGVPIAMSVAIDKTERLGTNVAAYIDNNKPYTVILGAHYDHLGYGEDGNSLFANAKKERQIHHGADDNASGTAAVLELAKWAKQKKLKHYNYLFLNFSGEELGLFGSKAFVKDAGIDSTHTAYMINMDMVGRLNDSTHALSIGGVGTSPKWGEVTALAAEDFKLTIDSAGVGPSDHTSFYHAGIPVLFLFTGTHKDYHKPSDKPDLINYTGEESVLELVKDIVVKMDKWHEKPAFTPTKQAQQTGKTRFKVTLGIMPDYSYQDGGVRVDGVSDGRPAANAGVKAGDIITRIGDVEIKSMQSYMEALGKFSPGDKTDIKLIRSGQPLTLPIELSK
jgi:aminopeptidase YwaD